MSPTMTFLAASALVAIIGSSAQAQFYNDPRPPSSPYDDPYDPNPGYTARLHDQSDELLRQQQEQQYQRYNWQRCNNPGSPAYGAC